MINTDSNNTDHFLLRKLREIILKEDRKELDELRKMLEEPEQLSKKVSPIIEERLNFLKENFPAEFKQTVEKIIDAKLIQSQERLLNILYPKIGQMIRKYIAHQFQLLRESIEQQVRQSWFGRLRARLLGINEAELILSRLGKSSIQEIYVIQRDSGLLLGSASVNEAAMDKEMIAGMLTAIKAFAEDAFKLGEEELDMIQYGGFQVIIYNFFNFYLALAINGTLSTEEQEELTEDLLEFAEKELAIVDLSEANYKLNVEIKRKLEKRFFKNTAPILIDQPAQ